MSETQEHNNPYSLTGIGFAIGVAVLFGLSTPFAKLLLGQASPVLLAALLYLGSRLGLSVLYFLRREKNEPPF